jgi:hypothetical protein
MKRWLAALPVAVCLVALASADDKPVVVEIGGLKSPAPAAWKKENPPEKLKAMRHAQFRIAKAEGDPEDGEVLVSYFGSQGAGTTESNVARWKGFFEPPAGEKAKVEKFKVGDSEVTWVDLQGTFKSSNPAEPGSKAVMKPNYRAIYVAFPTKKGPYYLRLLGPAKTIDGQHKAFEQWVKNFK